MSARRPSEEWRSIDGRPGFEVSSLGRVRGCNGQMKSAPVGNHGYRVVGFWNGEQTETDLLHRVVAVAFHGPAPFVGAQVAHKNGNRLDCHADNIRWATAAENAADKYEHGTHLQGQDCPWSKLTDGDVLDIRWAPKGTPLRALAARYGVSVNHVAKIRTRSRRIWPHIPFPGDAANA